MPDVVVDASAVVELLLRTGAGRTVARTLAVQEAVAPDLLDVEVLHALRRQERQGAIGAGRGALALRRLARLPLERVRMRPLLADAWVLRANLSAYDAVYVVLARRLTCPLVTADRRLAAAPGLGVAVTVVS